MTTDGERIARLEERWRDMRQDIADLRQADARTRDRLHQIEGMQGLLVEERKQRTETAAARQKRLEVRIQVLTVVVAIAAVATPVLYHYLGVG